MNFHSIQQASVASFLVVASSFTFSTPIVYANDLNSQNGEYTTVDENIADIESGGIVNVQGVGKYSTQEGADVNGNGTAQVLWDVQWSTSDGPGGQNYIYMLNETDIFVPKAVENIHLTLGQAVSSSFEDKSIQADNIVSSQEVEKAKTRNDVRTMIELKQDPGDIDFNSFYQDDSGQWKRLFAGEDIPENYTKDNMLDVGSVAYVQEDLTKLPEDAKVPEGVDESNLDEYKMIRIASDKKGMHSVRVSGTINVSGAKSDVYVPLRATNRIHYVGFDRQIIYQHAQETINPVTGETVRQDWISTGPLPAFSIRDKKINNEHSQTYAHEANQLAGFYTTDQCKVTLNTYSDTENVINSAGLDKIQKDIYDINDIQRGTEKEDGCDQSALRINTDNIRQMNLWEKILNLFR